MLNVQALGGITISANPGMSGRLIAASCSVVVDVDCGGNDRIEKWCAGRVVGDEGVLRPDDKSANYKPILSVLHARVSKLRNKKTGRD